MTRWCSSPWACSAAAERADNDFRQLLLEQEEQGVISTTGGWAAAKPKVRPWMPLTLQESAHSRHTAMLSVHRACCIQQKIAGIVVQTVVNGTIPDQS